MKDIARFPGPCIGDGNDGVRQIHDLAALIEEVNRNLPHHVLTIEDLVEFTFDRRSIINQREIGVDSLNFATALRAALRQDPDVILVGEPRPGDG